MSNEEGGDYGKGADNLNAPFPWIGGKSRVAPLVWERFGADVPVYTEPFFGSGAVLSGRPGGAGQIENVNDKDGFICNVFRAIQQDPQAVAKHADRMSNENDMHAIHAWLVEQRGTLTARLEGDPDFYDAKIAGWWLWGCASWIGSGWCAGNGPWRRVMTDLGWQLVKTEPGSEGGGVKRQRLQLGDAGRGVNRKLLHLGDAGRGVNRQLLHLGDAGMGVNRQADRDDLYGYMQALSDRFRRVRVCCGDWERICGPTPTFKCGTCAVFLDPPYSDAADRDPDCYAVDDDQVAHRVRDWCLANGDNPLLRIALAGYSGEGHEALEERGWDCVTWKAKGGYGNQGNGRGRENAKREALWFSHACLKPSQGTLRMDFEGSEGEDV